jgi:hypothetical protein
VFKGFRPRRLRRDSLQAAPSGKFDALLAGLNLDDAIASKTLRCKFCNRTIQAIGEIEAVFPESGAIKVIDSSSACAMKLATMVAEGKVSF